MPRLTRVAPIGIPQHVIQRGNNHQACFGSDEDMKAYASWLKDYAYQFKVEIHAWVFMTNHTHILCTPKIDGGVSKMMQSLGRMYVSYFNYTYKRTGTLWEGRYKACLVQSEQYLMEVYRYIELNPVRASMVTDPADYSWSSYQCNALGKKSSMLTEHPLYLGLGQNAQERQTSYRSLFGCMCSQEFVDNIRLCTNSGLALGSTRFKQEIEQLTGCRVTKGLRGRPRKSVF
jgi:putative transposase